MRLIGTYDGGPQQWSLVEIAFYDIEQPFALDDIVIGSHAPCYDMRMLDGTGTREIAEDAILRRDWRRLAIGDFRLCFFVEASTGETLSTPLGAHVLGPPLPKPARLRFVRFYAPGEPTA